MLVLATLMIPDQLRLVPVFVMLSGWGLVGSFQGYMLIKLVLATNLFFMRQYFLTIPKDFEEAAKLDNAGHFKTYWKVMLPLTGPALAAISILTFQGIWNEFFWPLLLLGFGDPTSTRVQLGIAQFRFQYQTLWPQLMAASVIAILPDRRPLPLLPALLRRRRRRERGQGMSVGARPAPRVARHVRAVLAARAPEQRAVGGRARGAAARELRADRARARHRRRPARRRADALRRLPRPGRRSSGSRPRSRVCGCTGAAGSQLGALAGVVVARRGRGGAHATARPARSPGRWHSSPPTCSRSSSCFQLFLWPLAVTQPRASAATAARGRGRRRSCGGRPRPWGSRSRCCVINALGAAAAVLPLLTVTVAYSFVAAARFALPPQLEEGRL